MRGLNPRARTGSLAAGLGMLTGVAVHSAPAHAQYVGHVSAYVMDANTGAVLSQTDPDLQRYPASLTKLMTLYLTFKALKAGQITLDQQVPVSIHTATMQPSKLGLVPGTQITVEQAMLSLVTLSANDSACALGELLGGGDEVRFANIMTSQARALGMTNTTFRNASGLPDPDQVTTARDLATLARHLLTDFPEDYHYFSVPMFQFHRRMIMNHDTMLREYEGADGMKTGFTSLAGHNLATSAMRSNVRLVAVVMGAPSNPTRDRIMAALLDRGFEAEGVAPPAHPMTNPVVLARASYSARHHYMVAAAAARWPGAGTEVAEAPTGPRRYGLRHHGAAHVVSTAHVRMVSTNTTARHKRHHAHG